MNIHRSCSIFLLGIIQLFVGIVLSPACVCGQVEIIIDCFEQRDLNKLLFGNNALGYELRTPPDLVSEGCCNLMQYSNFAAGQWNPMEKRPNIELLELARQIKITSLRFPGGCGAHDYNWKATIGPLENRPNFQFGLLEFLSLCDALGAEPIITLSYFTGNDEDLSDLVQFLNGRSQGDAQNVEIDWADLRGKSGHPDSYKVKYFEFGNEVYHGNHRNILKVEPGEYARRYMRLSSKLKSIDPEIKLGLVLQGCSNGLTDWDRSVLQKLKCALGFAIVHIYPVGYKTNDPVLYSKELFEIALAAPDQVIKWLDIMSYELKEFTGKVVPLAITEYNGYFFQEEPVPYRHCLGNALLIADLLRVFMLARIPILSANYWHFANGVWGLVYNCFEIDDQSSKNNCERVCCKENNVYHKRPNYFVFEMLSKHFGNRIIEPKVFCPTYSSRAFGNVEGTKKIDVNKLSDNAKEVDSGEPKKHVLLSKEFRSMFFPGVKVQKNSDEVRFIFRKNEDINYFHTFATKAIDPGRKYCLSGMIRTQGLTSSSGVCLEVQDVRGFTNTAWAKATPKIRGTTNWKHVTMDFQPLGDAKAIRIIIRRVGGGGPVNGIAIVRDIELQDIGPAKRFPATSYLSSIASLNEKNEKLYLMVINKHLTKPLPTMIRVRHFAMMGKGTSWTLNGPTVDSTNENSERNVKISSGTFSTNRIADYFEFVFEPHSLTTLEIRKDQGVKAN